MKLRLSYSRVNKSFLDEPRCTYALVSHKSHMSSIMVSLSAYYAHMLDLHKLTQKEARIAKRSLGLFYDFNNEHEMDVSCMLCVCAVRCNCVNLSHSLCTCTYQSKGML
jgi:hypothetical protein